MMRGNLCIIFDRGRQSVKNIHNKICIHTQIFCTDQGMPDFLDEGLEFYGNPILLKNSAGICQPTVTCFNPTIQRS